MFAGAVAYQYEFLSTEAFVILAFLLATAAFYNTLVIKEEIESRESLENAQKNRVATQKLDSVADSLLE